MTPNDLQQSIEGRLSHKQITRHKRDSKEMFVSLSLILINCFHWLSGSEKNSGKKQNVFVIDCFNSSVTCCPRMAFIKSITVVIVPDSVFVFGNKAFYLKKWLLKKGIHQCTGKKYCSYLLRRNVYILLIVRLEKCYNVKKEVVHLWMFYLKRLRFVYVKRSWYFIKC